MVGAGHTVYFTLNATPDDFSKMARDDEAQHAYLHLHGTYEGDIKFLASNTYIRPGYFEIPEGYEIAYSSAEFHFFKVTNRDVAIDFYGCYLGAYNDAWRKEFPNWTAHYSGRVYDYKAVPSLVEQARSTHIKE